MEIKAQIPPITAMATPAVRLVVITAEAAEPLEDEPDYGRRTVFATIGPVLALHYLGEEARDKPWAGPALLLSCPADRAAGGRCSVERKKSRPGGLSVPRAVVARVVGARDAGQG